MLFRFQSVSQVLNNHTSRQLEPGEGGASAERGRGLFRRTQEIVDVIAPYLFRLLAEQSNQRSAWRRVFPK